MSTTANKLFKLFSGLDRAYGTYNITKHNKKKNKQEGHAETVRGELTPVLWELHLAGKQGLGVIPIRDCGTIRWGAIDIDVYDIDLSGLEKRIEALGLPLVLCRTKSGGAHCYLFCAEDINASKVRIALMEWAALLGYAGSEIFPKQSKLASDKDVGNWINMPYFNSVDTTRYALLDGQALPVAKFIVYANKMAVRLGDLATSTPDDVINMEDGPPCLQALCKDGFPKGTRNKGLFNLGVYTKLRFGDNWQDSLDALNNQYITPPLPSREVTALQKSVAKKDYFYTCQDSPISNYCNKKLCLTRKYGIGPDKNKSIEDVLLLGSIVKILTDPPTWVIDLDGYRIELLTDELLELRKFRKICMERLNKLPPLMKQGDWDDLIRPRIEAFDEQAAPPDAPPQAHSLYYL